MITKRTDKIHLFFLMNYILFSFVIELSELALSILGFIMMPLVYNIFVGIEFAIVSYVLIKILSGRMKDVSWLMAARGVPNTLSVPRYMWLMMR